MTAKQKIKKTVALFLAFVMTFSVISSVLSGEVFAAVYNDVKIVQFPRAIDSNQNGWDAPKLNLLNGWSVPSADCFPFRAMGSYDADLAYCIEPGVEEHNGNMMEQKGEDFWEKYPSDYNDTLNPYDIQAFIGRIIQYGYTGPIGTSWVSTNSTDANKLGNAIATQMLIWETVVGERDEDFKKVDASAKGKDNLMEWISKSNPVYSYIISNYNRIVTSVQNHKKIPSFCGKTLSAAKGYTLKYDGSKYTVTLTDTNNVLSNFNFTSDTQGVTFSKSGNKLTISCTNPPSGKIDIQANKIESKRRALITWSDGTINPNTNQMQDVVTYGEQIYDPVYAYINVEADEGNLKIIKTSEDGNVSGIAFNVKSSSGTTYHYYTNLYGEILAENLPAGSYTVTEVDTPDRYIQPQSQTITVKMGQTATVNFRNNLKRGSAQFIKTDSETGDAIKVTDATFGLYQWSNSSNKYVRRSTLTYNSSTGKYVTGSIPVTLDNGGKYKIVEEKAPTGYVLPKKEYTFQITENNQVVNINGGTVSNAPQKGKIQITKLNKETGKPVTNNPAVFEIRADGNIVVNGEIKFKSGDLVDTITTNSSGVATSKELYLGKYKVTEKTAPDGYVVDKTTYSITLAYQGQTVSIFTESLNISNQPQKGKIQVTKLDKETGQPVVNNPAVFEIYADEDVVVNGEVKYTAGSLIETISTNENGVATSSELYLGKYKVIEKTAPDGYVIDETEYFIELLYKGQTVSIFTESMDVANQPQKGKIQVTKLDKETGQPVVNNPAVFEIYADEDIVVNGEVKYTAGSLIETITTNENGVATSSELYLGKYKVIEKTAPEGYVIDETEYFIELLYKGQTVSIFTESMEISNQPQKGKIQITKLDKETGQPVVNNPAVFEIYADEDIVVNGEVKYTAGSLIETITTDENGVATSSELYLGKYKVIEKTAPEGYVIDETEYFIELLYKGQTISIFTESMEIANQPQKGVIEVTKYGEVLTRFDFVQTELGIVYTPVYEKTSLADSVFRIYAMEDIVINGEVKYQAGELVDTVRTLSEEVARSQELYLGKYLVREEIAPNGYFIGSNEFEIELTYQGQTVSVFAENIEAENERQKIKIRLQKTIEENPIYPNPNAYQDIRFGIFTREDIKVGDEVVLPKDSLVDIFGIDEYGQGISRTDLSFGKYYIKEIQTATGLVINDTEYDFEFTPLSQDIPLLWININDMYGDILNETIKGRVAFIKRSDLDNRVLEGATYGIYRASDDELIAQYTTDKNGYAISDLIPYGEYYLQEITPPEHFHIDLKRYDFFIGKNGQETITIDIDVTNEPIIGAITARYTEKGYKEYLDSIQYPSVPLTADTRDIGIAVGAATCSLIVISTRVRRRRKKNK